MSAAIVFSPKPRPVLDSPLTRWSCLSKFSADLATRFTVQVPSIISKANPQTQGPDSVISGSVVCSLWSGRVFVFSVESKHLRMDLRMEAGKDGQVEVEKGQQKTPEAIE